MYVQLQVMMSLCVFKMNCKSFDLKIGLHSSDASVL